MKVVTEILQDLEILKRFLKHNAKLKIRINYYLTHISLYFAVITVDAIVVFGASRMRNVMLSGYCEIARKCASL